MKLINKHTDYALAALCAMASADSGDVCSVSSLAEQLELPRPFLRKIMQVLSRNGVVTSSRGHGGGFRLATGPARLRIGRIVEIFQGPVDFTNCFVGDEKCPRRGTCQVRSRLKTIEKQFIKDVCNVTIAELVRD